MTRFVFGRGNTYEEHHLVKGDYVSADGGPAFPQYVLEGMRVAKARLTGKGERWASVLRSAEDQHEDKRPLVTRTARSLVLRLVHEAEAEPGVIRKLHHPSRESEGRYTIVGRGQGVAPLQATDSFDASLVWLVRAAWNTWSPVDFSTFSGSEEKALNRLIRAGLLEARAVALSRMDGFDSQVLLTCRVRGDYPRALLRATLEPMPGWLTEDGRTQGAFTFIHDISEVRLTDQGEQARHDLGAGQLGLFLALVRGAGPAELRIQGCTEKASVQVESKVVSPVDPSVAWPPMGLLRPERRDSVHVQDAAPTDGRPPAARTDERDYERILNAVRHGCRTFETTPDTYSGHDEEGLRDVTLAVLNGRLEGAATGETFRGHGKTDIRIEYADRSAFVAECKVWDGPKDLAAAVDQLMRYLTWRDCKTALVLFNKTNARFGQLLETVPRALSEHPLMRRDLAWPDNAEWRFVFSSAEDSEREVTVHVFLFNLYAAPR